jgi:hypothetical protein
MKRMMGEVTARLPLDALRRTRVRAELRPGPGRLGGPHSLNFEHHRGGEAGLTGWAMLNDWHWQ